MNEFLYTDTEKRNAKALKRAAREELGIDVQHTRCLRLVREYRAQYAGLHREELAARIVIDHAEQLKAYVR